MIRRFGERVDPRKRYIRRPGAYAILRKGSHILLTHQAAPIPELQLPGGGIDPGEHPLPALHREVMEETGYRIRVKARLGAFRRFTYMPEYDLWAEKLCHIYLAQPGLRIGPPTEAGHMAVWLPIIEATEYLANDGDTAFLRHQLVRARQTDAHPGS